ncbi:helix-turn-helix transcriptional regulator [Shewanella sp. NFH-SH190041]|uniref:LuxR C-terminal-related transcriptional regulator n=1 Tax=Shewanella sp. NFH-SH190041 TaxID=2950245 RepID=UPI0021C41CB9|nr:LuxR C-terminal-related transcriptional regulator [Shewanella sp. NFH-SH190041]BDM64766.1 helix-turn-helix transcriptional regulator [Shewanella sp. NFH-SH190041]
MFKVIHWMLVSRSNLLAELLDTRWPQEFLVKLTLTEPEKVSEHLLQEQSLVVIDLATVDLQKAYQLQRQIERLAVAVRTVFVHYPRRVDARFLVNPSVTAGVFYIDNNLSFISQGLSDIMNGRYHIPTELLKNSSDDDQDGEDTDSLTIREREVLQALLSGATNQDIARKLFVSESTIKTHLYRAFRKIGVSSRGQAIAWAQTHLHEVQV